MNDSARYAPSSTALHMSLEQAFLDRYGTSPRLFSAPGRVNLIGEHTDYNDGFVLPMAIAYRTYVAGTARNDGIVRVSSLDFPGNYALNLNVPGTPRRGLWVDYVEGVAQELRTLGVKVGGADLLVHSHVPAGAGLSSSAALELAVGLALTRLSSHELAPMDLARIGQNAEHHYVGTLCGIMDQAIAALGQRDHALLIDCRSLETQAVPFASGAAKIVICDTRVKHELASSEYNTRRAECAQGVELLARAMPGIRALRDVTPEGLASHAAALSDPVRRRCRHVVNENARTLAAVTALRHDNHERFGELMFESHASLRDDYEVSCAELDTIVEIATQQPGVYGARMTGGGFGGSAIALVASDRVEGFIERIKRGFAARFDQEPNVFVSDACDGAREE